MAAGINSQATAPAKSPAYLLGLAQDVGLIFISTLFVIVHARHAAAGEWTSIPFAIQQAFLAVLFLVRRRSRATSVRLQDWIVASIGGWLPLAFQVHESPIAVAAYVGFSIQVVGATMATVGIGALGRSFGIVAANRGLKTTGPYGLVRHPVYACHMLTDIGFLVANFYWLNVVLVCIVAVSQILRIRAEERVLADSGPYAEYRTRVRYRLLPGVF